MLHGILNSAQHQLAKRRALTRFLVRVRNQANCVIAFHLGETADAACNGEFQVVSAIAPQAQHFVDVGANVGAWTHDFLAKSHAHGIAFEPSSRSFAKLQQAVSGQAVEVYNVAVGDEPGEVSFVEDLGYDRASSIAASYVPYSKDQEVHTVKVVTLDDLLYERGQTYDFVKIDAEGYDLKIIKGARRLLSDGRIRFLQFEYNEQWLGVGSSLREALALLESLGFETLLIRSTGLHKLRYEVWGDYFRYSNFLAFRPEDRSVIEPLIRGAL